MRRLTRSFISKEARQMTPPSSNLPCLLSAFLSKCLDNGLRIPFNDGEQRRSAAVRHAPASLPVLHRVKTQAIGVCERRLREPQLAANALYVDGRGYMHLRAGILLGHESICFRKPFLKIVEHPPHPLPPVSA